MTHRAVAYDEGGTVRAPPSENAMDPPGAADRGGPRRRDRIDEWVHVGLGERPEVFAEKLRLYPQGCLALALGERVAGYVFSHPWRIGDAPPLDAFLGALPASPDCLYLHDIAIPLKRAGDRARRRRRSRA